MRKTPLLLLPAALLIAACQPQAPADPEVATPPAEPAATAGMEATDTAPPGEVHDMVSTTATAELKPTQGNTAAGTLAFAIVDGGIRVTGEVTGLAPGSEHGFHVHENGDCSAPDATSAGGHFNPAATDHGRVGHGAHHAGDSDNIVANDQGVAAVDTLLQGATLGDGEPTEIIGRGVIVHADPDDYATQPTGNAGARLACGVIIGS
ncbi:superoxide dismutase family protein [Luteimonas marina]|uniref:Superoxide dismutase [Cu-Zn] n=1 Tax=Luteimonas marina TaxID=488485 RepID=A0A5C5U059_9GAMM|nr:superoxide dismutase family protein [Luteimonas marina]TWT19306.1 superoxide dismutase family protein [Luteimonas marina]